MDESDPRSLPACSQDASHPIGDRPGRFLRRDFPRSGLREASPTLSLLSAVPIRAANLAPLAVAYQLRITLAIDPSRAGRLALLKPSGRLFRVLISPRTRVHTAKVDPDASVLRLETPATRPVRRGGDRTRNGRGEYRRPLESGRRACARRNVPAPPGLHALESRRNPRRAERGRCESGPRGPVRFLRTRAHAGSPRRRGGVDRTVGRPREFVGDPGERIRSEPGPRRHGCPRAAGTERDPRRSRERIAGFLRLGRAAS